MASLGYIESLIRNLPQGVRSTMQDIVRAIVKDIRFGHPNGTATDPCENFGGAFFSGTTAATPGDEFTIAHGFGRVPYLAVPVLPLDQVNAGIVDLTVSRAADNKRVYFTSTVASAAFTVFLEG